MCLPDDHSVGEATFPFREIDLGDLGGNLSYPADEKRAKATAAREVLLDDFGDALGQRRLPREGEHRDGNLVGAAPYDLDGELGAGRAGKENG